MSEFKPNGSWILVPDPIVEKTKGGIILDEASAIANSRKNNILEVLYVGPAHTFVKVGDTVMVDPRTEALKANVDGKDCLFILEHQILGKW
jgi:co-chaperonin GroES (HSP10)